MKQPIRDAPLVFLDCETGSLDPTTGDLIEIAVIRTDPTGEAVENRECWKIRHETTRITLDAMKVNGWNKKTWDEEGIDLMSALVKLRDAAKNAVLVGHNIAFDLGFIDRAMAARHFDATWRHHKCDTVALAWPLLVTGRVDSVSLGSLATYINHKQQAAHTAADDAETCRQIYLYLMAFYGAALQWAEAPL